MLFLYLRRTKVNETAETETETGDDAEGENVIEVTSEGTCWAFKQWAVHLMFPPDAVSEHTSIVVHRWKYSVRSPPVKEHEAITSHVIELSSLNGQELKFNTKVKLSLSHSATDLQGYELVMKKLIDKETNYWEDVDGTRDIRCRQGFEDNHPSHMKITDFFFPVAQADISECSTYAVVCRLKASPTYTITSGGGSFSHPDFPGVTVTIPENAVTPKAKFPLELKVQEVSNEEFEVEGKFLGPVLRIKCFQAVQFLKPVAIQLPISLREQQDLNLNPSTCLVRVLFLKSHSDKKEWIEITDDLVKPPSLDRKFVRFHVERFSAYSYYVERKNENSRFYPQRIINFHNSRIVVQPTLTVFFAYFRPDLLNILCLICCPAHLKGEVLRQVEKQGITPIYKNSKEDMVPGHDKASVLVSGGICPREESDMEEIYLRLLEHDPDDAELEVRFRNDKTSRVEFYGISKARVPPLCRLHLRTPTKGARQPSARMEDSPTDGVLQNLSKKVSNDWRTLGRQLNFREADLQNFDNSHRQISEKAYAMLLKWKQRDGSDATYSVLNQALCDERVERKDLAEEFCCY
ncbi:unnamed protein product [Porites evermanni]|uniref:Uncharacterized protein n=1 Tax=Porites evermanni TaxID=104178 RepID=A0ABN8QTB9_9CNID|nr:unnamed protein product [Porites evermanni]